jgi:hypothetical protein
MTPTDADLRALPLDELRARRAELQRDDDAVSYVRRLTQARLDLVRAEQRRRVERDGGQLAGELPSILGTHLTGGPPRPPRPADDFSDHPLAVRLDELCARHGATDVAELNDDELATFAEHLAEFERARSDERRELFGRIDELSAELVRRYRDGEASVDGLLDDE